MRRAVALGGVLALAALTFTVLGRGTNGPSAAAAVAGQLPTASDGFEPLLGMPATNVVVLGSAPAGASGEAWAYGELGDVPASVNGVSYADQLVLLEHTDASDWQVVGLPAPSGGALGSGRDSSAMPFALGALGGRVTAAGGVVLLTPGGIVTRDPGSQPTLVRKPSANLLGTEESLPPASPPSGAATPYAATEEAGGHVGLLVAPYGDGHASASAGPGVLRHSGSSGEAGWTREPIIGAIGKEPMFAPEAIACGGTQESPAASSPDNCWMLAAYRAGSSGSEPNRLALFRRVHSAGKGSEYAWEQQRVADWLLGEGSLPAGASGTSSVAPLGAGAQMLTVTPQGAWVDFQARIGGASSTTDVSKLVLAPSSTGTNASVLGTWCFGAAASGCEHTLESSLPVRYRSFAAAGGSSLDPGTRIVTGVSGGALLELSGPGGFTYAVGPGGSGGGSSGAAFGLSPQGLVGPGFIGEGGAAAPDDQGQSQLLAVIPPPQRPQGDQLQPSPVPFRHPLLAVAQAPGSVPGDPNARAIAVGLDGEVGRYTPGQGWSSEALYNAAGEAQKKVTLRGVVWPEPDRAYAVGDGGEMWLWRADTGLWEPDPAKPYNFVGHLTAIAFSPSDPSVGYAVGKQGVLLRYGKTWEEISLVERAKLEGELKMEEQSLNFTSVAFAGGEALATYRVVVEDKKRGGEQREAGGLLVEDGSGWHVDPTAASLLAQLPDVRDTVLSKVAGLPDGGAVAAGPSLVIERDTAASPWRFAAQPLPEAQNVSALAAYREASGALRAVVSIDLDPNLNPNDKNLATSAYAGDLPPPTGPGQPSVLLSPDPVPDTGYVLQETASGWSDMEHMALGSPSGSDMPVRPDPVLALLVSPDGSAGLAVGGQTENAIGEFNGRTENPFETAAAMRFGAGGQAARGDAPAAIATTAGAATFAVGGGAACEQACANFAQEGLAPDALLAHALQTANQIAASSPGALRGFLYTGDRLLARTSSLGGEAFERELSRYAALLGSAGALPVHAAASPNDLAPSGGIEPFAAALEPFGPGGGKAYYSFLSEGATGGRVMVIVLDYSGEALGEEQQSWLVTQLQAAKREGARAIVMGNASLGFKLPEAIGFNPSPVQARDAAAVSEILVKGGASAYLFDYPGVNVKTQLTYGAYPPVPAFGTGTLGYASPPGTYQTDAPSSSGFLLVEVPAAPAAVKARVEPNIGQLALDATDGVLLRRSRPAYFEALARVPLSGRAVAPAGGNGDVIVLGPEPYEPIPFDCLGPDCADRVPTDYTFTSSKPDVGNFVAHEPGSANPRQVLLGANGKPIPDPHSGLLCAYNAGTTTVSITAGGLTYSEPVTVQGGSAEYPCGTVPLLNPPPAPTPVESGFNLANPNTGSTPAGPINPRLAIPVPPPPLAPRPARPRPPAPHPAVAAPLVPALGGLVQLPPVIVPPAPTAARPSPPSGTTSAQVYQSAVAPENQREDEEALDIVHSFARSTHDAAHVAPRYLPLLILLLAFGGSRVLRAWREDLRLPEPAELRHITASPSRRRR